MWAPWKRTHSQVNQVLINDMKVHWLNFRKPRKTLFHGTVPFGYQCNWFCDTQLINYFLIGFCWKIEKNTKFQMICSITLMIQCIELSKRNAISASTGRGVFERGRLNRKRRLKYLSKMSTPENCSNNNFRKKYFKQIFVFWEIIVSVYFAMLQPHEPSIIIRISFSAMAFGIQKRYA